MKNLIYVSALDGFAEKFPYGIETIKRYCDKYNIPLVVALDRSPTVPVEVNGSWYPWFDPYLINSKWEKVLILDADIMINPTTPNLLDFLEPINFAVVRDSSPLTYGGIPHLNQWRSAFDVKTPPENYFNGGFVYTSRKYYLDIVENLKPYYEYWRDHPGDTNAWEQTPLNIVTWNLFALDIVYLPKIWNDMVMFNHNNFDFIQSSYIWHFTGPNMGGVANRGELMRQTYELIKDSYGE
jgi:hypothetical protein